MDTLETITSHVVPSLISPPNAVRLLTSIDRFDVYCEKESFDPDNLYETFVQASADAHWEPWHAVGVDIDLDEIDKLEQGAEDADVESFATEENSVWDEENDNETRKDNLREELIERIVDN